MELTGLSFLICVVNNRRVEEMMVVLHVWLDAVYAAVQKVSFREILMPHDSDLLTPPGYIFAEMCLDCLF